MSSVFQRIARFNKDRLPEIVKLKYKTMALNSFSFFRGSCHLFYEDLSKANLMPASPLAWVCGDLHLENFGSFKGDDHQVYFDLNDFDEAILAPVSWELVRMVTSIFVAFDNLALSEDYALKVSRKFLNTYASTLTKGKAIAVDPRTAQGIVCSFLKAVEKRKQKDLLKKRAVKKKGQYAFLPKTEKYIVLNEQLKEDLIFFVNNWIETGVYADFNYKVVDSIFRIAGTGSMGVKRYIFLLESFEVKNKFLLLDMKQARHSSLESFLDVKQPVWESEAKRAITIKSFMQNVSPALLADTFFKNDAFIMQELQPTEDKINFQLIKDKSKSLDRVIDDMARLTASAQLRSSGRLGSAIADELIAFGQIGDWHKILTYGLHYARQIDIYYNDFIKESAFF